MNWPLLSSEGQLEFLHEVDTSDPESLDKFRENLFRVADPDQQFDSESRQRGAQIGDRLQEEPHPVGTGPGAPGHIGKVLTRIEDEHARDRLPGTDRLEKRLIKRAQLATEPQECRWVSDLVHEGLLAARVRASILLETPDPTTKNEEIATNCIGDGKNTAEVLRLTLD